MLGSSLRLIIQFIPFLSILVGYKEASRKFLSKCLNPGIIILLQVRSFLQNYGFENLEIYFSTN
jgi:hypothetical protein